MYAPAGNLAEFKGVLIRSQYKAGQNYVQLLFQTDDGLKLSISHNLKIIQSLKIGKTYSVKGREYVVKQKSFIYEPKTKLVRPKKKILFASSTVSAILLVIAIAVSLPTKHSSANGAVQPDIKNEQTQTQQILGTSNISDISNPPQNQTSQTSTNSPTTSKKTTIPKTNSTTSNNNTQTSDTPTPQPTPATPSPEPQPEPSPDPSPPPPPTPDPPPPPPEDAGTE